MLRNRIDDLQSFPFRSPILENGLQTAFDDRTCRRYAHALLAAQTHVSVWIVIFHRPADNIILVVS